MNKKTITPNPKQPVERKPAGQLPNILAELSEAALSGGAQACPAGLVGTMMFDICSYDGGDDE
ncbi:MAG: DUF5837 family cyanobactin class RiPP [Cyanobacteriota bacterium]|nr:DUF5837 family cyanobactin class RiPP [Cyanobacteriota bacterium]